MGRYLLHHHRLLFIIVIMRQDDFGIKYIFGYLLLIPGSVKNFCISELGDLTIFYDISILNHPVSIEFEKSFIAILLCWD
jgi:hypothetical protein